MTRDLAMLDRARRGLRANERLIAVPAGERCHRRIGRTTRRDEGPGVPRRGSDILRVDHVVIAHRGDERLDERRVDELIRPDHEHRVLAPPTVEITRFLDDNNPYGADLPRDSNGAFARREPGDPHTRQVISGKDDRVELGGRCGSQRA
jgi:hypothetical protein